MSAPPSAEREAVIAFLRRRTNLESLAQLIADGAHRYTDEQLERYCKLRGITLKKP